MTGRLMFGIGVNSDAGLVGSVTLDEQNFDWSRFPTSWEDIRNGTAFRGAGQRFRLEAMPGTQVQQYSVSFQNPYLNDTQVSLGLSGFYFNRIYTQYTEQDLGGRISLGYQFSPDLSGTIAYRGEKINITNPQDPLLPALAEVIDRDLALHGFKGSLQLDKRDNAFLATEGYLISGSFEQVLGSFQYPRADVDLRKYFTLYQRPDGSGRQVLTVGAPRRLDRRQYAHLRAVLRRRFFDHPRFPVPRRFAHRDWPKYRPADLRRRRLRDVRLGRVHVPHHCRRYAPRRGVLRLGHGRANDRRLDEQISRRARLRPANHGAGDGPRANRLGLRLPAFLEPRRQERAVQLLHGLRTIAQVSVPSPTGRGLG